MIHRDQSNSVGRMDYTEFRQRIDEISAENHDTVVDSNHLAYFTGDSLRYAMGDEQANGLFNATDGTNIVGRCSIAKHAFQQLSERLEAPPTRWSLTKADGELRADVMNAVIRHRENSKLLLRQDGDVLRAVLSDQYSAFNHGEMLDLIDGALEQMGETGADAKVFKGQVGDVMRGYVLLPRITFGDDPRNGGNGRFGSPGTTPQSGNNGGGLHPAAYFTNSEIGTGKVRLHGGLYSGVCDNGMIYGWNEKVGLELIHRHVSRRTIASAFADALVAAFEMSEDMAKRFVESQTIFMEPHKITKLADKWAEKYGLTLESTEAWKKMVDVEAAAAGRRGSPALFDVVNAVTFSAQEASLEEAELMQRIGGDLLYADLDVEYIRGRHQEQDVAPY